MMHLCKAELGRGGIVQSRSKQKRNGFYPRRNSDLEPHVIDWRCSWQLSDNQPEVWSLVLES